jgi:hypothetical protein
MRELTKDDKLFCETFVDTFDFQRACNISSSNRAEMMVKISDETDGVNIHIRNAIDSICIANKFMTDDLVASTLSKIMVSGETKYQLQSAKMLLEIDSGNKDKTKEFRNLIKAITKE